MGECDINEVHVMRFVAGGDVKNHILEMSRVSLIP